MSSCRLDHDWFEEDLPQSVRIGDGSWLYSSYAFLHMTSNRPDAVVVENNSGVYNGTFFDLGPKGEVSIGNYCAIVGAIFSVNREVFVGDYAFISHEVVIADFPYARPYGAPLSHRANEIYFSDSYDSDCKNLPPLRIGSNSWIGAQAILHGAANIGEGAIVGAGAVVDFDVPDGAVVAGNPAGIVGTRGKHMKGLSESH